jgi:hypothetical protein
MSRWRRMRRGEACSTLEEEIRTTVFRIIQKERDHVEYLIIDGRIILK